MKSALKNLIPVIFLFGLAALFFIPYLTGQKIPYAGDFTGSDLTELDLPLRQVAAESLKAGQMPLWTDRLANGFPVLAEGQAGVFYPPNLLFVFLPFNWAVNLSFFLNFFLAGLFIYLYARVLKISPLGALFSAVAFSFSGFFIFRLKHLNLINAAVWLPLLFYLIEKYFSTAKNKLNWLLALAAVFTVQFFAGFPPILYVSLVSGFVYFCLKILLAEIPDLKNIAKKIILPWILIGLVFFGLAAIQLLPTFSFSGFSGRGQAMDYSNIIAYPYAPASLGYFISPYFLGNPATGTFPANLRVFGIFWENNIYFGLLPLVSALLAIFCLFPRDNNVKRLAILALGSFLFIFGDFSPLFIIFWKIIPGFSMFRFPQRFLLLALVCLTVLAGFGFDLLWQKLSRRFQNLKSKMLLNLLLPLVLILIAAADLFLVGFKYFGVLDYQAYFSPAESAEFLKKDKADFRIYSLGWPEAWQSLYRLAGGWQNNLSFFISGRELIPPNLNIFWGLSSAQDRASLEGGMLFREAQRLGEVLAAKTKIDKVAEKDAGLDDQTLKIFGLQNVKYLLSYRELTNGNLPLVKEIKRDFLPPLKIYQNKLVLPQIFAVFETLAAASQENALTLLFDQNFDPSKQIILAEKNAGSINQAGEPVPASTISIKEKKSGEISLTADFSQIGYLFFSQNYDPGWQAKIDGQKAEIWRANYAYMAILAPAGKHEVIFYYQPLAYIIGKWISIFSLFLVLCLFSLNKISHKTRVN
ncbi:MAG: hypothetical protein A3J65_00065 [Candidatus Buchananbacteria bacterium RIFCSPHIGHO2_02_FULL_45_11b]|uniref:Membrane protein 6-pyruvoyl-tetrahydropterin synthase-related domain-containing protein n=3 Tax=Candidatus Buchananiibacteriota TaxID=1817903 RepID=A0A1G1Y528_9BACT|nr:MAG: hypothetical protein A2663_04190 [Candidatus Buchananbacteria bacterium RIFCSPHIGHO2_01_FULL_46_12]OGY50329.1 MAG: hypothetical protein A3J65_00065 [Candidatus Buchananbacteria bacterium RIFCSPHIGHO2_02_FULL_45_11b]OGY57461.1 MAG: hypothetical protein A3H67_02300 [Candidatus Buchananbacteria bacterium RIFCSPLOWO2_02_FULL_46_11b]